MSEILSGFLLELQEIPYNKITISSICRRINIARKSFYRHFRSKQDCLLAVIDDHLVFSYKEAEQGGIQQYFWYWSQHRDFLRRLKVNDLYPILVEQAVKFVYQSNPESNDAYRIRFIVTGVFYVILHWVDKGCRETPAYLEDTLRQFLTIPFIELS